MSARMATVPNLAMPSTAPFPCYLRCCRQKKICHLKDHPEIGRLESCLALAAAEREDDVIFDSQSELLNALLFSLAGRRSRFVKGACCSCDDVALAHQTSDGNAAARAFVTSCHCRTSARPLPLLASLARAAFACLPQPGLRQPCNCWRVSWERPSGSRDAQPWAPDQTKFPGRDVQENTQGIRPSASAGGSHVVLGVSVRRRDRDSYISKPLLVTGYLEEAWSSSVPFPR